MIAAIYARKSTEQNVSDDAKSVTRQVELGRVFAEKKGWTVEDAHIYIDDAISGAEYLKRPAYLRMMAALEPAPPFGALIVMEQSRLGRDTGRVLLAIQALEEAGVEIWSYQGGGSRISVEGESGEVNATVLGLVDRMHRRQSSKRGREVTRDKAAKGHVAGGVVFGYHNLREAGHVRRVIYEPEATIIRRIFQMAADEQGLVRIAKTLNADGIPAPRNHGRGWAPSAIREMLYRPLYRGQIVYCKTRWQYRGGGKVKVEVPESDWLTLEAPALRIIEEPLWRAAQAVLQQKRESYLRLQDGSGRLFDRPAGTRESPYLLSGLSVCARCQGSLYARVRPSRGQTVHRYYGCFRHHTRGPQACANALSIPMDEANRLVVETLQQDVLTPALVARYAEEALGGWLEAARATAPRQADLARRLSALEGELRNLTDAIAKDTSLASVQEAIRERERERAEVSAQLAHLEELSAVPAQTEASRLRDEIIRRLGDWRSLLARQPVLGRQILKKLLDGRLEFEPFQDPVGAGYRIRGRAVYRRLLLGVLPAALSERRGVSSVVPPG